MVDKCNYKFMMQQMGGALYRLPVINFNQPPFTGKSHQSKRAKEVYSENPNLSHKIQQQEKSQTVKQRNEKTVLTHIISIPLNFDEIMPNYEDLVTKIKALKFEGVQENFFQASNLLHVTLCAFDFGDDQNLLSKAKATLIKLQPTIQQEFLGASCDGKDPKPFYLTLKGLNTFQNKTPTEAQVLYCDFVQDEGYEKLKKITSRIIQEFVNEKIVSMEDLQNVNYDYETQMWEVKFHMTVLKWAMVHLSMQNRSSISWAMYQLVL
eukprot:403364051